MTGFWIFSKNSISGNSSGFTIPCCRADGAKVATKERALGGHTINWYSATIMGAFGNRLFEPKGLLGEFPITAHNGEQHRKPVKGFPNLLSH